mgnify:CR=1 FL=1
MNENLKGVLFLIGFILWWVLFFILYPYMVKYLGIPDNTPKTREDILNFILFISILIGSCIGIPLLYALTVTLTRRNRFQ